MVSKKTTAQRRITKAFNERCNGIPILLTDIPRVFKVGHIAIDSGANDQQLGDAIAKFVDTIREQS